MMIKKRQCGVACEQTEKWKYAYENEMVMTKAIKRVPLMRIRGEQARESEEHKKKM